MKLVLPLLIMFFAISASANQPKSHISLHKPEVRSTKKYHTNDLFKSYLELSSFRHKTLAQNVANVNTPGYKADEVEMPDGYDGLVGRGKSLRKINIAKTSTKHIGGSKESNGRFASHKLKDPYETKRNGNNVSMSQQMVKIAENKNNYNTAVKGYATLNSLYSTVVGK